MKTRLLPVALSVLLISMLATTVVSAGGPILNRVSVGGPDVCTGFGLSPGCDASFSLQATKYADGSVSGQYTDQFGHGFGGFHAVIDCLVVAGNEAWVGGVITHETITGDGSGVGLRVSTRVKDNGNSANDPADQISFSVFEVNPEFQVCTEKPEYDLFDAPQGQVKVN